MVLSRLNIWKRIVPMIACMICLLSGCESKLTDDPSARLMFSVDTLRFDTVFTSAGSATRQVRIYNPNRRALQIRSVKMQNGESFKVNLDGEQTLSAISDLRINGGDSLFLFVRATIRPEDRNQPVFIEDKLLLEVGNHAEQLVIEAYGWDVELIDSLYIGHDTTLLGRKPYLVSRGIYIDKGAHLTIAPGCHFFMHDTAKVVCLGGISACGTLDAPVRFQSDRLDDLYEGIRYLYVGGKWNGIYLSAPDSAFFSYTEIVSGSIGLYLSGTGNEHLTLLNSRIHNCSVYGLVLQDIDALVANTEISNCAQYCIYSAGGKHQFIHTTVASFFNHTQYAIQTVLRDDQVSPLYISNLSKRQQKTEVHFLNSILAGIKHNCLMLATPLPSYYLGSFAYSYLQTDTLSDRFAHDNIYSGHRDTSLFVVDYYADKERYYDFRLDSLSPARDIADSLIATRYPLDRRGRDRFADHHPDAGCYEY